MGHSREKLNAGTRLRELCCLGFVMTERPREVSKPGRKPNKPDESMPKSAVTGIFRPAEGCGDIIVGPDGPLTDCRSAYCMSLTPENFLFLST